MTDTSVLQARLAEAETALHELEIGKRAVTVSYDGKSVTFRQADTGQLRAYIANLKHKLGTGGRVRARRVAFG